MRSSAPVFVAVAVAVAGNSVAALPFVVCKTGLSLCAAAAAVAALVGARTPVARALAAVELLLLLLSLGGLLPLRLVLPAIARFLDPCGRAASG